jgi:rhodanese-related sulfurtransferase
VLVVDVREDDFAGGHITGCIHFPVDRWGSDYELDAFIEDQLCSRSDLETVVVHCYLSQQRGPFCARRRVG